MKPKVHPGLARLLFFTLAIAAVHPLTATTESINEVDALKYSLKTTINSLSRNIYADYHLNSTASFKSSLHQLKKALDIKVNNRQAYYLTPAAEAILGNAVNLTMDTTLSPLSGEKLHCDEVKAKYPTILEVWEDINEVLSELAALENRSSKESHVDELTDISLRLKALEEELERLNAGSLEDERVRQVFSLSLPIPRHLSGGASNPRSASITSVNRVTYRSFNWNGLEHVRNGAYSFPGSFEVDRNVKNQILISRKTSYVSACLFENNLSFTVDLELTVKYKSDEHPAVCPIEPLPFPLSNDDAQLAGCAVDTESFIVSSQTKLLLSAQN